MAGLYFEECKEGLVIEHAIRRTVTETDNVLFSAMTYNCAPLHIDAEYAKNSIYGQRLVNSMFLLALVAGVTVQETTLGTTLGNLGFQEVKFPEADLSRRHDPRAHGDRERAPVEEPRRLRHRDVQAHRTESTRRDRVRSGARRTDAAASEAVSAATGHLPLAM